jgi:hypothetical protein
MGRGWVVSVYGCRLTVVDAFTDTVLDESIDVPNCAQHIGVSVDYNGFVWLLDSGGASAGVVGAKMHKLDPETHDTVFVVEGFAEPNVRSDMTGTGLQVVTTPPAG